MLKLALGQFEIIPGRPDLNTTTMLNMIQEAKEAHVDILVFPALAISGQLLSDTWKQADFVRDCISYGQDIIEASSGICVIFGNVAIDETESTRLYNALFVAQNGSLQHAPDAQYPFSIKADSQIGSGFDEARYFTSLETIISERGANISDFLDPIPVTFGDKTYTLGCSIGDTNILRIIEADIHITIDSAPFITGSQTHKHATFSKLTADTRTPFIYVNATGIQNSGKTIYLFDGISSIYDKGGQMIAVCKPFASTMQIAELNIHGDNSYIMPPAAACSIAQIHQALHYGVKKFLDQIGVHKIVIGASGGIDSAVAAALYVDVVGKDNVLLVNMPSRFNSDTTKNLSRQLAENLGCHYAVMPIQEVYTTTVDQLKSTPILHTEERSTHNLTVSSFVQENIQARDRSSRILAGIAAAWGGVFTCNANKVETTIGYCTLYGDAAGFLAALADLWKHQVYELAYYFNTDVYGREVVPQGIIDIVPSAELSDQQCVDEGKGDPLVYPYHDYLFRAFIENQREATPEKLLKHYADGTLEEYIGCEKGLVAKHFPTAQHFISDLERWWKQFTGMAVAKRIQSPPIIAVTHHPYGAGYAESQNSVYFTRAYHSLKNTLLS